MVLPQQKFLQQEVVMRFGKTGSDDWFCNPFSFSAYESIDYASINKEKSNEKRTK